MFESVVVTNVFPDGSEPSQDRAGEAGPFSSERPCLRALPPTAPRELRPGGRRPVHNGSFKEIGSETSRERAAELSLTEAGYTGLSGRIQKLYATDEFLGTT